jgi:Kef-type K+ transport system membrane component KefB
MRTFLAILLLISLALLATSPRLYRLRRRRPVVVMISGGWLAIAAGVLIGPRGAQLITMEQINDTAPLLMVGLGWIGMMVGLQLRRDVLAALPRIILRIACTDAVVSTIAFGALAWAGMRIWSGETSTFLLAAPVVLLACGSISWSMETRSLRPGDDPGSKHLALLIRATGALGGVIAVTLFGLLDSLTGRGEPWATSPDVADSVVRIMSCLTLAVALGLIGRWTLQLAGRSRDQQLVVFIGIVAFIAGMATQFRIAPLFGAMVVGMVIANLSGGDLRRFEQFILKAEHVVAAVFAMLVGVLLSPHIGLPGVALALAIAAARMLIKPALLRFMLARSGEGQRTNDSALLIGPVRQSPLALAMGVTAYLLEPSALSARLLTVIVLAGVISDCIPLAGGLLRKRTTLVVASEAKLA